MPTKINVQRICQFCSKEFTAQTTKTKFCCNNCAKRAHKERKRTEKIQASNIETEQLRNKHLQELKAKEFLTVTEVSKLLNCSRQNIYKMINSGKLKAKNILQKKTIVRRLDIDKLINQHEGNEQPEVDHLKAFNDELTKLKKLNANDLADYYTLSEIVEKYQTTFFIVRAIIEREGIPKIRKGKFAFLPKENIDKILG